MNIKVLAKFLNRSESFVQKICKDIEKPQSRPASRQSELVLSGSQILKTEPVNKREFTRQQSDYLTSDRVLREWAGYSILERTMLFKKKFKQTHITPYKLRKLYKQHGIKKKFVRFVKGPSRANIRKVQDQVIELREDLESAILMGFRIVQVDEMLITKSTFPKIDWAKKYDNSKLELSKTSTSALAVVAGVSREAGVELMMCFPKSINTVKYKTFLDELRRLNPFTNMILQHDNLNVVKNETIIERMNELGFRYCWTPAYSPEYNSGIEETWNMSKQYIKKERLNALVNGKQVKMKELLQQSFDRMSILSISKCINRSLHLLNLQV